MLVARKDNLRVVAPSRHTDLDRMDSLRGVVPSRHTDLDRMDSLRVVAPSRHNLVVGESRKLY